MTSIRADQRVDGGNGNQLQLYEASTTADQGLWDIIVSGGVLKIRTRTDKDGAGVDILSVTRSGTTGTIIALALALVPSAADDAAAAALTPVVPVGGLYRTASAVKIRVA
jgi:hypothetical protein